MQEIIMRFVLFNGNDMMGWYEIF